MIAALLGDVWPYLAALAALVGAVVGIYSKGRADEKTRAAVEEHDRAVATRKGIKDALEADDSSRHAGESWIERLRKSGL